MVSSFNLLHGLVLRHLLYLWIIYELFLNFGELWRNLVNFGELWKIWRNLHFFLTSVAEKTKTQAQNSSQKLKEKTQPQGGTFPYLRKTQEKITQFYLFFS